MREQYEQISPHTRGWRVDAEEQQRVVNIEGQPTEGEKSHDHRKRGGRPQFPPEELGGAELAVVALVAMAAVEVGGEVGVVEQGVLAGGSRERRAFFDDGRVVAFKVL